VGRGDPFGAATLMITEKAADFILGSVVPEAVRLGE
jgi:hypothetical protein